MTDAGSPRPHVADLLRQVAGEGATGCLEIRSPEGAVGQVWLRGGRVYSVRVPGFHPMIGVRMLSSGRIGPDQLAEALEVQRADLPSWRIGDILVHLGFVAREEVDAFVLEQLRDQTADLLGWEIGAHRMLAEATTRDDVAPPVEVEDLLSHARERLIRWAAVVESIGGADAIPVLATRDVGTADVVLGPHDWALLCKVDGARSLADLARACGFTVHEAGQFVQTLVGAGLLEVEIPGAPAPPRWYDEGTDWVGTDLPDMDESMARVTAALAELLATHPTEPAPAAAFEPAAFDPAAFEPAAAHAAFEPAGAQGAFDLVGGQAAFEPVGAPAAAGPGGVPAPSEATAVDAPQPTPAGTPQPVPAAVSPSQAWPSPAPPQAWAAPPAAGVLASPASPASPAPAAAAQPAPSAGIEPTPAMPAALPDAQPAAPPTSPREAAAALSEWVRDVPVPAPPTGPAAATPDRPTSTQEQAPPAARPHEQAPAPPPRLDPVDAAALMRELSSLSGGGEDPTASARPAAPRPAAPPPVEHHKKKRHGLFGR